MEKKPPIKHIAAGAILGAFAIVYTVLLHLMSMAFDRSLGWIVYLILFVGVIVFISLYAKAKDNHVTFGHLFGYGFKITAIFILIYLAFVMIYYRLVFPEFKEKMIEISRQDLEQQGKMSDSQIDEAMEITKNWFWFFMAAGLIFFSAIIGLIASLIGAAIPKKRPVNPFDQLDQPRN